MSFVWAIVPHKQVLFFHFCEPSSRLYGLSLGAPPPPLGYQKKKVKFDHPFKKALDLMDNYIK
jgi:hypothetical protein